MDLGLVNDKTVISLMYWDPDAREAWLHTQIVVKGTEEANPLNYVQHMLRPEVFGTPIVLPPDAATPGRYTMSSQSLREFLESYELNVYPDPIRNPPDAEGRTTNLKSFGINMMRQMMEIGTLHINENCQDFIRECQNYYADEKGRFSDPDDCIDSARYALLGCLNGWAEPYDSRSPNQRFRDAKHNMQVRKAYSEVDKPAWKRAWNPAG
jgi:hypothetical protein